MLFNTVIVAFACTIFLSAFLLFAVQPMIGKIILPWFGGSAAVWSTCLMFFQAALLGGYLYAHWSTRRLQPRNQAKLHIVLMAISLALLPILPSPSWKPTHVGDPSARILLLLTATIGLPYLLLATTSPLLQAWYVAWRPGSVPYRLFALSNFGSLLALFSFPLLVEPFLTSHMQAYSWSAIYAVFVVLCSASAWQALRIKPKPLAASVRDPLADPQSTSWKSRLLWVLLPACASVLLLSITTHLSMNVAPIPLLWVLPLGVYLLSFILCFENEKIYNRAVFLPLFIAASGAVAYTLYTNLGNPNIHWAIPVMVAGLFVCCMVCHGEMVRLKPDPEHLTSFYLLVSLGGALGGLFVAFLAPHVFHSYVELPLSLAGCGLLAGVAIWIAPGMPSGKGRLSVLRGALLVPILAGGGFLGYLARHDKWDLTLVVCGGLAAAMIWLTPGIWSCPIEARATRLSVLLFTIVLGGYLVIKKREDDGRYVMSARNFYGVLRVEETPESEKEIGIRRLVYGTIEHGLQLTRPSSRRMPISYYGPDSGMGRAITYFEHQGPVRIGVVGLGAGVSAAYCRPGDFFRFYEINPLDLSIASTWFTFLHDCPGDHQVYMGDARLTMERQPSQQFDVLAVDAFTSDAIPIHLLTREAFSIFFRHIKPTGVLAMHVSNRYLDLVPVVARNAKDLGKSALTVEDDGENDDYYSASTWVLVTSDKEIFHDKLFQSSSQTAKLRPGLRPWTDDYSNLFQILKPPTSED